MRSPVRKMESVLERMKREGTSEKIASFMVKEKQPYEFNVNMHKSEWKNLRRNVTTED